LYSGSCNESLCWISDSEKSFEVLINGLRRGVSPKHRFREKSRPQVSKVSLFQLYTQALTCLGPIAQSTTTYFEVKRTNPDYCIAKRALIGENGLFSGWRGSGVEWESFNLSGECAQCPSLSDQQTCKTTQLEVTMP